MKKETPLKNENTIKIKMGDYEFEFKKPTYLVYLSVVSKISNDKIDAMEILFDNLFIGDYNKVDFDVKLIFFTELYSTFFKIDSESEVTVDKMSGNFKVKLFGKEFELKKPDRLLFKELATDSIGNKLIAWKKLYDKCYYAGYRYDFSIENDLNEFVGAYTYIDIILYNKLLDLKKN